ncbi:Cell division and transport-associated protein TolR [Sulfurivirga caldicuralii]|uniref:Cell division and transport-associated protein TolR n=1 Tax=Sulfurivirga caldicuralii TaxID=364032 RepID=A0A1N6EQE9_9GAMM|nr:biopolymer transporter ExbD [Sulfurivirga caldicuralii]SIN85235.1 Cell division and transport-associated protein TolR [Sulfurivirga caldicuralii]
MARKRRGYLRKAPLIAEINVVPYVDVTLVLLIIFMVTAPIVQQAVWVDLPATPKVKSARAAAKIEPFVITVTKEGLYRTSADPDRALAQQDLARLVAETVARAQVMKQPVYIQGDRNAPYGKVVKLFVILRANGVDNVALLTQPEDAQ